MKRTHWSKTLVRYTTRILFYHPNLGVNHLHEELTHLKTDLKMKLAHSIATVKAKVLVEPIESTKFYLDRSITDHLE